MNALSILSKACTDFDDSYRGHLVAMQAVILIGYSKEIAPLFAGTINMSKGFNPEFNGKNSIENLFEEIEHQKNTNYQALRKNCLLGVCAGFEAFVKTFVAALSYDPNWRVTRDTENCLLLTEIEDAFEARYKNADVVWKKTKRKEFIKKQFDWLDADSVQDVIDIIWLRNQVAHNNSYANCDCYIKLLNENFCTNGFIEITKVKLSICIKRIKKITELIAKETPYLEGF